MTICNRPEEDVTASGTNLRNAANMTFIGLVTVCYDQYMIAKVEGSILISVCSSHTTHIG